MPVRSRFLSRKGTTPYEWVRFEQLVTGTYILKCKLIILESVDGAYCNYSVFFRDHIWSNFRITPIKKKSSPTTQKKKWCSKNNTNWKVYTMNTREESHWFYKLRYSAVSKFTHEIMLKISSFVGTRSLHSCNITWIRNQLSYKDCLLELIGMMLLDTYKAYSVDYKYLKKSNSFALFMNIAKYIRIPGHQKKYQFSSLWRMVDQTDLPAIFS